MKRCPQCGQTYNDGSLSFCLMDGAPLAETDSEPTVVIGTPASSVPTVTSAQQPTPTQTQWVQSPAPKPRGSRVFLWIGLLVVVILLGGGALVGLLIYLSGRGDNARVNLPGNVSSSPSPKRVSTPKPSPSPSAASASTPREEPSEVKDENDQDPDSDEITPITWNTSAAGFKNEVGKTYRFRCPPVGTAGAIWGSDIYTSDSSVCTAAVHAGLITLEDGGVVTIEYRPGRKIYGSTVRNGITSNTFGEYDKSFVVRAGD